MLTFLILAIGVAMILVLIVLVIVVVGIRQEALAVELKEQAPTLIAALVRSLLRLYVRKPDATSMGEHGYSASRSAARGPACPPNKPLDKRHPATMFGDRGRPATLRDAIDSRQTLERRDVQGGECHCRHIRSSK